MTSSPSEPGPDAPFAVTPAAMPTALVFASPHSGEGLPADMGARPGLEARTLHSGDDSLVNLLAAAGPAHGAPLIAGRVSRAFVDLNRDPADLDPALIEGVQPLAGGKAAGGYGVVPRLAGDGSPLYDRRLGAEEARARVAAVHTPYHAALADLMQAARAHRGRAVLVDWHSMPGVAGGPDVVLGDRHGAACGARLTRRLRALFEALGWSVGLNHPYAGGYATRLWGRPDDGFEAVQIEISRRLYLDEAGRTPGPGFEACRKGVSRVIAALCEERREG